MSTMSMSRRSTTSRQSVVQLSKPRLAAAAATPAACRPEMAARTGVTEKGADDGGGGVAIGVRLAHRAVADHPDARAAVVESPSAPLPAGGLPLMRARHGRRQGNGLLELTTTMTFWHRAMSRSPSAPDVRGADAVGDGAWNSDSSSLKGFLVGDDLALVPLDRAAPASSPPSRCPRARGTFFRVRGREGRRTRLAGS